MAGERVDSYALPLCAFCDDFVVEVLGKHDNQVQAGGDPLDFAAWEEVGDSLDGGIPALAVLLAESSQMALERTSLEELGQSELH